MAGWRSDCDSDDEPLNCNLFIRKSFGFHGFSEEKENILKTIVKQLGATCDELPKYIFTTLEHFNSLIDNNINLYNVSFIRDSVDANRCLNIDQYRFGSKCVKNKSYDDFNPCCNEFHNGQNACFICDPKLKPESVTKQKKKKLSEIKETINDTNNKVADSISTSKCLGDSESKVNNGKRKSSSWEPWESRLMLDYIICNNQLPYAKSPSLFRQMFNDGFLTHRTPESMRVHFRTQVLRFIETFDLPKPVLMKLKKIRKSEPAIPQMNNKLKTNRNSNLKKQIRKYKIKNKQKLTNK